MDPDDAELHFRKAVLHRKAGQPAEAEACWRRILTLKRPDQFCSIDQGIYGHLTLRNLAVLAEERTDRAEARRLWRMVLDACPGYAAAVLRGSTAVNQGASSGQRQHDALSFSKGGLKRHSNPASKTKRPWPPPRT